MKKSIFVIVFVVISGFASASLAADITVNLEQIDPKVAEIILQEKARLEKAATTTAEAAKDVTTKIADGAAKLAEEVADIEPAAINSWVDVFANAMNRFCETVNIQANELLMSPVGVLAAVVIALKVGAGGFIIDIIFIPIMIFMWVAGTIIFIWALKCILKQDKITNKLDKEGKIIESVVEKPLFSKEEDRGRALVISTIIWLAYTMLCLMVMTN